MKFGPIPIETAQGAVLAHSTTAGERRFRKAHRLSAEDVALLRAAGVSQVVAAVLAADDLGEDAAAQTIAESMAFVRANAIMQIDMTTMRTDAVGTNCLMVIIGWIGLTGHLSKAEGLTTSSTGRKATKNGLTI